MTERMSKEERELRERIKNRAINKWIKVSPDSGHAYKPRADKRISDAARDVKKLCELGDGADSRIDKLRTELATIKYAILQMRNHYPREVEEFMRDKEAITKESHVRAIEERWSDEGWGLGQ